VRRAWSAPALLAGALLVVAGCHDPVTEIVVVVDSELSVPGEVGQLQLEMDTHTGIMRDESDLTALGAAAFPATIGLLPRSDASYSPFDLVVSLLQGRPTQVLVAQRKVSGVRFARGQTLQLFVSFPRACACAGTNCPNATAPACADIATATLTPFDPRHLPRVTASDGGATPDVGAPLPDAAREASFDVAQEAPAADASGDAAAEASHDAATEAPAKLPRGHACGDAERCQDGFCVDGVCCESACACGTCNADAGHCAAAMAGTDPHSACGVYTCDGAGACESTCAGTFGACSSHCAAGSHCDGAGKCVAASGERGYFCIAGSCMCKVGLSCPAPDGGGAGACQ
jgi:hypothetical protein